MPMESDYCRKFPDNWASRTIQRFYNDISILESISRRGDGIETMRMAAGLRKSMDFFSRSLEYRKHPQAAAIQKTDVIRLRQETKRIARKAHRLVEGIPPETIEEWFEDYEKARLELAILSREMHANPNEVILQTTLYPSMLPNPNICVDYGGNGNVKARNAWRAFTSQLTKMRKNAEKLAETYASTRHAGDEEDYLSCTASFI